MDRNAEDRTAEMIAHVINPHLPYNAHLPTLSGYVDYRAVIGASVKRMGYPIPDYVSPDTPIISIIIMAIKAGIHVIFTEKDEWIINILDASIPQERDILMHALTWSGADHRRHVVERIIDSGCHHELRYIIEYNEREYMSDGARWAAVGVLTSAIIDEDDARIDALISTIPTPTHRMAVYNLIDNIYHAAHRYGRVIYTNGAAARVVWYIFMFIVRYADIIHLFGVLCQASLPEAFIVTLAKMVDTFVGSGDWMNAKGCYPTVCPDHVPVLVRYVPIRYAPELHGHLTHMAYVTPKLVEALVDGGDDLHSYQSYATNPVTSWTFLADAANVDERVASMYTVKKVRGATLRDIINHRDMRNRMLNGAYADVVII